MVGPPAGGKSTWVREHAQPGDITIDYDALANALTPQGKGSHEHTAEVKKITKAARQAAIDAAMLVIDVTDVYIIHSTPSEQLLTKYRHRGAQVITCDPGKDVALARAKAERPWWMQGAIKRWYEEHSDMTANPARGGHHWRELAARYKVQCSKRDDPCWQCGQKIDYAAAPQTSGAFEADHYKPVATHPHLALTIGNLRPSHSSCNRSRGSKPAIEPTEWIAADF